MKIRKSAALVALLLVGSAAFFAGTAWAVTPQTFTRAVGFPCNDYPNCSGTHTVEVAVSGASNYQSACAVLWGNLGVYWPRVSYHHADANGVCWFDNAGPIVPFGWWNDLSMSDPQNRGACGTCTQNPINTATGNKFQIELDYANSSVSPLRFERTYNSEWVRMERMGSHWRHNFDRSVAVVLSSGQVDPTQPALVFRGDGKIIRFTYSAGQFVAAPNVSDRLIALTDGSGQVVGYQYLSAKDDETETFDIKGRLVAITARSGLTLTLAYDSQARLTTVTDPMGRSLAFTYNAGGRIASLTNPAGGVFQYAYDSAENLTTVTYPGGAVRTYLYNEPANIGPTPEPLPWTKATVYVCHNSSCTTVYTDVAYVKGNDPRAACQLAASQAYYFGGATFGGARGGPSSGECYYNYAGTQPSLGGWTLVSGCVSGSYPNQVYAAGTPGCPVSVANALTGITDENGDRFATYKYDYLGRAVSTEHAGGAQLATLGYDATETVETDALGAARTYGFQLVEGVAKNTSRTQPGTAATTASTFDANGNLTSYTDYNGNRANHVYDTARNLEIARTEGLTSSGASTPQTRTISTTWHSSFRLPTAIAEPLRITTFTYDPDGTACGARGALCSKSIQATTDSNGSAGFSAIATGSPRIWTYTYNANGSTLTVNGPRTDVTDTTTYSYYANNDATAANRGNVATISNAAGHVTQITSYNGHGQPLTIVDANALTTTLSYDARMRLTSRSAGGETTTYAYDDAGQLTRVTLPDGSYLDYTYDDAHRITQIADNLGDRVLYTLDAMGNRTAEEVRDPANVLAQTRARVYDTLNRLFREIGASSQTTEYTYDDQGNVLTVKDPLNHVTGNQYDALNRLKQVTDPGLGVTQFAYNGLDALTQVTDPRNLATSYTVDGLGDIIAQTSPDTGSTSNTYDLAGNLLAQTDAKGQVTTYGYDALNRVTLITFHDGSKQAFAYDAGTNGIGHLTSITESDPSNNVTSQIAYAYDLRGRVTSDTRTLAGIAYATGYRYDTYGRLDRVTYPSGRTVDYSFDSLGRVSAVSTTPPGGSALNLASSITYFPFGGVKGVAFGNGQTYARTYDQDGRIASYTLGGTQYGLGYDAASRIEFIADTGVPANTNTYGYDALDRLTSAVTPGTSYSYSYDAVGNRTSKTVGTGSETYAYSPTSNRLASVTPASGPARSFVFDANGSTTDDGNNTYVYDARGRMVQATSTAGTTTYQVNALGQRMRKTNASADTTFTYDLKGHLIAESAATGSVTREYVWLGEMPIAAIDATGTYFIQVDHLNTPRLVANATGQTVWRWDQQEPFGNTVPDENPSGVGVFDLPLRFAGQRYDQETGLYYNYYRDYDPSLGRYGESDPIGLRGGINTYLYANGNGLLLVDPNGLQSQGLGMLPMLFLMGGAIAISNPQARQALLNAINNSASNNGNQSANPPTPQGSASGDYCIQNPDDPICQPQGAAQQPQQCTIDPAKIPHIFRNAPGHMPNTPANQQLLIRVASNPRNFLGVDQYGTSWYAQTQPNGTQVWAQVRNNVIRNGGLNLAPRTFNPQTGLARP